MNVLPATFEDGVARFAGHAVEIATPPKAPPDGARLEIGVRPEFVTLRRRGIPVRISRLSDTGRYRIVDRGRLAAEDGDDHQAAGGRGRPALPAERAFRPLRSRRTRSSMPTAGARAEAPPWTPRPPNQKAWWLVRPGGAAGRVQRRHPADDGGQLLGAGDLRRQRLLLRGRQVVRAGAALASASTQRCSASCSSPASSWPSRSRSAWPSRWPCRAAARGCRCAWC